MAYSLETLEDIRKSILDTIAMVERENAMLTAKIDSLKEPSGPTVALQEDEKFLEELNLNESINGVSFRNVSKEVLDDSTVKITADLISGKEECSLEIKAEADGKVKDFTLAIEDTSSLMEIKQELSSLIKDVNLTYTLKAIASFSRMQELRSSIVEDLLDRYEDFFKVDVRLQEILGEGTAVDSMVVSAVNKNKHATYFEVTWNLKWNHGMMGIQHIFIVTHLQGLSKAPRLKPQLKKLEEESFIDGKCFELINVWRDIAKLVADE